MSRIGNLPVEIPSGVKVDIADQKITVKGSKGTLVIDLPRRISIKIDEGKAWVAREDDAKKVRALHGLTRALLANAVKGVSQGFEKKLELVGVGYRAAKAGKKLNLSLGFSHPVDVDPPAGVEFQVEGQNIIFIRGADRQSVGQVAADIRSIRPVEPYKGKGVRYAGEIFRKKAGKAGKTGAAAS